MKTIQPFNQFQVLSNIPEQWPHLIHCAEDMSYYAYIYHDKDIYTVEDSPSPEKIGEVKKKHLHILFHDNRRHTIDYYVNLLQVPANMIDLPRDLSHGSWRAMNRYLIHLDNPEKAQYNPVEVYTNRPTRYLTYCADNREFSTKQLYFDYIKVRKGDITPQDFLDTYEFYFNKNGIASAFNVIKEISKYEQ